MNITYATACSGIEAPSVAWESLGWAPLWFSEIDKYPCAALAHHYPAVPNLGSMNKIPLLVELNEAEAPDVFIAGTPCQSFSVAGLRQGLADERGGLTLKYVQILNTMDEERLKNGKPATIAVWENVPGVLSSADNAFGCFLAALAGEDAEFAPPSKGKWPSAGYIIGGDRTIAWRVLDAQYFGVAQRRRRVFVVASARDDICVGRILFELDGVRRGSPPSREAGQALAAYTSSSFGAHHEGVGTLRASGGDLGGGTETLAVFDRQAIGRKPENGPQGQGHATEISYTLTKTDQHAAAYCASVAPTMGASGPPYSRVGNERVEADALVVALGGATVRRLTPIECERLQGFPDNYTKIAENTPNTARYKTLGNAMAVPVIRWIGQRIEKELREAPTRYDESI